MILLNTIDTFIGHDDGVWGVNFDSDGKILASASADNTVKLWNIEETPQAFGGGNRSILDISFSPKDQKDQTIASASDCKIVKLWDINGEVKTQLIDPNLSQSPDPKCDERTKRSHTEKVRGVAFSPDGKYLASGASDGTARLWRVETLYELLARGCHRLSDYFISHPKVLKELPVCKKILHNPIDFSNYLQT